MRYERQALIVALFLAGIGMRVQLVGVGPLLPLIRADLAVPYAVGGLLVTLPVLCMGLVAIPAGMVAGRFGPVRAVATCLAVLTVAGVLRAVAPDATLLVLLTVPVGIAIGLGTALLPIVAKTRMPLRPAAATSAYVGGFVFGSTLASSLAVPLAELGGTWRAGLLVMAAVTVVLLLGWAWALRGVRDETGPMRLPALPWRRPVAWLLAAVFGLQAVLFFGLVTWLPAVYVERGVAEATAGLLSGVFVGVGLPTTVIVGWLGDQRGSRRAYLTLASGSTFLAIVGLIAWPEPAFLWALLAGFGLGITFPLALVLPLDVSHGPAEAAGYLGVALALGYLAAAVAPYALGAARDASGSFEASLWVLAGIGFVSVVAAALVSPDRLAGERALSAPATMPDAQARATSSRSG